MYQEKNDIFGTWALIRLLLFYPFYNVYIFFHVFGKHKCLKDMFKSTSHITNSTYNVAVVIHTKNSEKNIDPHLYLRQKIRWRFIRIRHFLFHTRCHHGSYAQSRVRHNKLIFLCITSDKGCKTIIKSKLNISTTFMC